jgi:hypothetical protein
MKTYWISISIVTNSQMKTLLPDIETTGNPKFKEFLAKQFVCDMLFPVYGDSSVTTIFDGWQGKLFYNWSRFTNGDGDILEFYAEGVYVVKVRNESNNGYQRRTPETIEEFIDDMHGFGIQLYWSVWIIKKYQLHIAGVKTTR